MEEGEQPMSGTHYRGWLAVTVAVMLYVAKVMHISTQEIRDVYSFFTKLYPTTKVYPLNCADMIPT